MTEERKKYFAMISKEERVVRTEIYNHQEFVKSVKKVLGDLDDCDLVSSFKSEIAIEKILIKALKKQLPAPIKEEVIYNIEMFNCGVCGAPLETCVENYCFKCGQKLR